jgi:flagellar hook-basal body complex protein FliE
MTLPIDPTLSTTGAEWQIAPVTPAATPASGGSSFATALDGALSGVQADQQAATTAVDGMVTGTSTDPTAAVMALERAQLSMQLASQIRNKAVEAFQDVFHTQV